MITPFGENRPVQIREILFATDFSEVSEMALPYAAAMARRFGATLCVVHIIPPQEYPHPAEAERGRALERMRAQAEAKVTRLLEMAHLSGIQHAVVLDQGDVLLALARIARERNADLIALGMHGRHGIQKMLLGSVADEILWLAQLPVLVVGPEVTVDAEAEVNVRHLLYASDFSPASGRAMHYAGLLAQAWSARLLLLHVVGDIWKEPASTRMATQQFLRMRLLEEGWMRSLETMHPELMVEFGPVEERILEVAERYRVELIVLDVPASEHPGLAAHLPGPLAYNVASHARCPVLAVRGLSEASD